MDRDLSVLTEKEYDVIIVGGGIFGVCAAWDAALRGLSVILLEKGDFGEATSANHYKMVHGGIRYLQHLDIYRVRESTVERSALLRIAPHLVHPLPIVVPTYGHGMKGREIMIIALAMYDALTFDRNRDIPDKTRQIPRGHFLSRQETLNMFPNLPEQGLSGAAVFHDGQMYNPPRLTLSFVKSAVQAGAKALNYMEVTDFIRQQNRVTGVRTRDMLTGVEAEVRGKVVLNAAGPWAAHLLNQSIGINLNPYPVFSRDAYFIVNKPPHTKYTLAIQGQTKDPDAVLSRGNRHLFVVPWRDYTMFGVWHIVHKGAPGDFTVTASDLQEFIDEINLSYPGVDLKIDDVSMWNAGLTLFGENKPGAKDLSYGKRSMLIDHAAQHGIEGLMTLIGVRFTTARGMAHKAVERIFKKLGKTNTPPCRTTSTRLYGGDFENFADLVAQIEKHPDLKAGEQVAQALAHNYGSRYQDVTAFVKENPEWSSPLDSSTVIQAEIIHAVREEMAQKLSDVVFRRTDLGVASRPSDAALETSADLMAAELGWNAERKLNEMNEVLSRFPSFQNTSVETDMIIRSEALHQEHE